MIVKKARAQLQAALWHGMGRKIPAYIHIPKTGGTYLAQLEGERAPVLDPVVYLGHTYLVEEHAEVNPIYAGHDSKKALTHTINSSISSRYCMFSTVRNPFEWLVSYAGHAGGWNKRYVDKNHYDYALANKSFDYLVKTIADRETQWPSRRFIHCQLFSSSGALVIEWLNNNCTLDMDLKLFAKQTGAKFHQKKKQRVGLGNDYRTYYSDKLVELVYQTWGRELMLFGFEFDGVSNAKIPLRTMLTKELRTSVEYIWDRDALILSGENVNNDQSMHQN